LTPEERGSREVEVEDLQVLADELRREEDPEELLREFEALAETEELLREFRRYLDRN
jgi:hypothetical protein